MAKKKKKKVVKKKVTSQLAVSQASTTARKPKSASKSNSSNNRYEKMQQRYMAKKNVSQKVHSAPKIMSRQQLEEYKAKLEPMVHEANRRIEMIQAAGYTSYAVDRVINEGGKDYFDLDEIDNREELVKEMTRMRVFINDKGSTIEGARMQSAQINAEQYRGKFGNQFNNEENGFAHFDTSVIDKDVASRAFEAYRKIESHRATEIVNDGAYGSENLIIALYDAEIRGLDSLVYGEELLDAFVKSNKLQWENARKDANKITGITGIIEDNITGGMNF